MRPSNGERLEQATRLMIGFAEREGGQRYLWTDAFAVCNLLAIARRTGDHRYAGLALGLVELVHETLGRHREDHPRSGSLDGAPSAHPTAGGLRIGNKPPERAAGEPFAARLEWDRDAQYLHHPTLWLPARDQVARFTAA